MGLQGIAWENFISRDLSSASQVLSEVDHEIDGPSHQYECHETIAIPVSITYQRGSRHFFAATKRCYLHPGWKGPCFWHRRHRNRTEVRSQCRMRGLQVSHQVKERPNLFSFMMMIQIQNRQVHKLERSSRSRNQRLKPYPLTWRGLSGT